MKNNKGFSLVELVIVIAIMAILVGVAVPVFSSYVEKSEKAMDKDLVAGVMDAVKKGTYSQMFVNNDSFKMGSMSYPVGFIVLTTEGAQVLASSTSMSNVKIFPEVEGDCELVTIENATIITKRTQIATCDEGLLDILFNSEQYDACVVSTGTITYCKSHTPASNITAGIKQGSAEITVGLHCNHYFLGHRWAEDTQTITGDYIVYPDELYLACGSSSNICEAAYANELGIFGTPHVGTVSQGNPLYDAIVAAYGNNFADLKLSYDGWVSTEGVDYATFYTSAPAMMKKMKELCNPLAIASQHPNEVNKVLETLNKGKLDLGGVYDGGEEVLSAVASNITSTHDLTSWMEQWDNDSAMTWNSYGFGLDGKENYSAARMAYNNGFASYLQAKDETAHLTTIREFYSQSVDVNSLGIHLGFPGLICSDAFTASNSPLKDKITDPNELTKLKGLYEEYLESDAFIENGKLVYEVLKTFNDTADIAKAYVDQTPDNDDTIFDYYNKYVDEMAKLYGDAQILAKNGIVIIVTVTDGELDFVVSPSEADPRKG